jgi:glutamyl-tRNA reductase
VVLISLTASHRELDLDALERLTSGSTSVGRTVVQSCRPVQGAVVISTCNRFELYLDVEAPLDGDSVRHATRHVAELVAESSGVTPEVAAASFTVRTGSQVPGHLFSVASGLDSMVVGEREIAGQVKRALAEARQDETTSKTLELLFQTASRTSKLVGHGTALGGTGRSLVALGLDLAGEALRPYPAARAVIIGTGAYAGASVAALRARGCTDVRVYSGSGRAADFAASHEVVAIGTGPEALVEALADADLVVSCSGARQRRHAEAGAEVSIEYVLDAAAVARARERAAARVVDEPEPDALVILDLALHRDVDPQAADVEGVLLYDLSTLKANAPATAVEVVHQARALVDRAAVRFEENRLGRAADAAVVALLDAAEEEVARQVEEAAARLTVELAPDGPTEEDLESVARGARRRVHADLHDRIVEVRAAALAAARRAEAAVVAGAEDTLRTARAGVARSSA